MPSHVDLTANVQRTPEELLRIQYSLDEVDSVIDGYPELDARLRLPIDKHLPYEKGVILGREVTIHEIPFGYVATRSSYRQGLVGMPTYGFLPCAMP